MKKYVVSCYSPPPALEIKKDDNVEVEGWLNKENILAEEIQKLTHKGTIYRCKKPKIKLFPLKRPKLVTKKGVVTKVIITGESVQFDLQSDE